MNRIEASLLCLFAAWLVFLFASQLLWLGFATGKFAGWSFELPRLLTVGFLLWGWLAAIPFACRRSGLFRLLVGVWALPGALVLLYPAMQGVVALPLLFRERDLPAASIAIST